MDYDNWKANTKTNYPKEKEIKGHCKNCNKPLFYSVEVKHCLCSNCLESKCIGCTICNNGKNCPWD
jgi:hypothetical protein